MRPLTTSSKKNAKKNKFASKTSNYRLYNSVTVPISCQKKEKKGNTNDVLERIT